MQNYTDEKSILVVLKKYLKKTTNCFMGNIPTLIVCLYDTIRQEIQKKSKIAVMTNPYWPFCNKSS